MTEEGTVKLIIDTPEGLRYVEAPDKGDVWASVEAYDALHGTNLYDLGEGEIWPDDGAYGKVIPADPDEIKAWFQKTDMYYHIMRNEDGSYSCLDCGHWFEVPEGEPLECPICRQIREAPELKPCPFCGEDRAGLDWTHDYENCGNDYYLKAKCWICGAHTIPCETGTEAAARWNSRASGASGEKKPWIYRMRHTVRYTGRAVSGEGFYECDADGPFTIPDGKPIICDTEREIMDLTRHLRPCPFCGSNAVIDETEDWDESGSDYENVQYRAFCANCGCGTSASDNPAWEAKLWNRTPESKDPMLE